MISFLRSCTVLACCVIAGFPAGCGSGPGPVMPDGGPDGGPGGGPTGKAKWTIMVYMAADNNLAISGIQDLEEMEAAGVDPNVHVVVQAEFSPTALAQHSCDASCFHRPNFNTFRYAVTGGASVVGPDGAATDIGNRDMTDPAQLHEFIQFAKQNYPADRYILVLWNHGGGYTGLLTDETSSGGVTMSLGDLPGALAGVGPIDIINFDMCLMGAYETLVKIKALTSFAVFSEQVEPGEGNPYTAIIDAIQANPDATTRAVANTFVESYNASYNGNRASTTLSAYDTGGFAAFEAALDTLAGSLQARAGTLGSSISAAATASQKYHLPQLTDVGSFLDALRARVSDATLQGQIDAVKALALSSTLRIDSRARNGTGTMLGSTEDVSRSTGLTILMPSGVGDDQLPSTGPASLAAYQELYPDAPWTRFLTAYLTGSATTASVDQGTQRFEAYLVWNPNAIAAGADIDLWILEPNGNVYMPFVGTLTPNGALTSDSTDAQVAFEGYLTNRYIQAGTYYFYADLWSDPNGFKPVLDVAYRHGQTADFTSLYNPNFPQLSLDTSWRNDPAATFAKIDAGAYTDLKRVAFMTIAAPPGAQLSPVVGTEHGPTAAPAGPTPAQLERIREVSRVRSTGRGSSLLPGWPRREPRFPGAGNLPW